MVDYEIVCSMCGDVGFPEKLFRCNKCRNRFQHSYAPPPTPLAAIPNSLANSFGLPHTHVLLQSHPLRAHPEISTRVCVGGTSPDGLFKGCD